MQTLFVHAGMMKTGTTSIQVSLAANPIGKNYRYLWHKSNNSSMPMRLAFAATRPPHVRGAEFSRPGYRETFLAYLDEQLKQDVPIGVISAELISATFGHADHLAMRDWLCARVPEVKVVLYIREPGSFMESIYQQKLKEGGQSVIRPPALYPKYRRKFEPLEAVFGRQNIVYRSFAPSLFEQGDIVLDFARLIGLDFHEFEVRRANDSLSSRAASLLYVYHQHLPPGCQPWLQGNEQKRRLVRLLHEVKGPKLRLAPEMLRKTLRQQQEDIDWMASRLAEPLPEYRAAGEGEYIHTDADLSRPDDAALDWLGEMTGERFRGADGQAISTALAGLSQAHGFQARLSRTRGIFS
jgi:hypothetical protein